MNPDKRMWIRLAAVALVAVGLMGLGACTERIDVMVGPFDKQEPSDGGEPAGDAGLDADSGAHEDAVADTEIVDVTKDVAKDTKESDGIASGHPCRPGEKPRGGCEEGLVCLSNKYGGVCAKPCESYAQCDNGGGCLSLRNGGSTPPSTSFCTHQCEPWDPEACGDKAGCRVASWNGFSFPGLWQCTARDGTLGSGKTCSEDKQCKVGWLCFRDRCRKPCIVGEDARDCPEDESGFTKCGYDGSVVPLWLLWPLWFGNKPIGLCSQ